VPSEQRASQGQQIPWFWFWLVGSCFLLVVFFWDYGFTLIFDGLSLVVVAALLAQVLAHVHGRGSEDPHRTLVAMFTRWVDDAILGSPQRASRATTVMALCFCGLSVWWIVWPPLKFNVAVMGLEQESVGPIQLSLDREPNKVEINPAGHAFVQVPGFNCGHIDFLGVFSSEKSLLLRNKRLTTYFLWRHRWNQPVSLEVEVQPSAEEKAERLYQSALELIDKEDYLAAMATLNEGLAIEALPESEKVKLLNAKKLCLLWLTPASNSRRH